VSAEGNIKTIAHIYKAFGRGGRLGGRPLVWGAARKGRRRGVLRRFLLGHGDRGVCAHRERTGGEHPSVVTDSGIPARSQEAGRRVPVHAPSPWAAAAASGQRWMPGRPWMAVMVACMIANGVFAPWVNALPRHPVSVRPARTTWPLMLNIPPLRDDIPMTPTASGPRWPAGCVSPRFGCQ